MNSPESSRRGPKVAGSSILVTGGCGFIGSHLVRELLARGASRLVVLDSLRYGDLANLAGESSRVELHRHTLGTDSCDRLAAALEGVDLVFHLAAEKHNQSKDSPALVFRANIDGTHELLSQCATAGVKRVVFTSSLYAYGRLHGPALTETEVPEPRTIYGISKLCGEHLCGHFRIERGLSSNVVRYLFVYGPRQFAGMGYKSVILKNFERILSRLPAIQRGDGRQVLDYIFIDDAVDATIGIMEAPWDGEVVNIGSGEPTTVRSLLETMLEVAGSDAGIIEEPPDWTSGTFRIGDISKAKRLLGWTPQIGLAEGLRRVFDWCATQP